MTTAGTDDKSTSPSSSVKVDIIMAPIMALKRESSQRAPKELLLEERERFRGDSRGKRFGGGRMRGGGGGGGGRVSF